MRQPHEGDPRQSTSELSQRLRATFGIDPVKQADRKTVKTECATYIATYDGLGPTSTTTVYRSDKTSGAVDIYEVLEGVEFFGVRVAQAGVVNPNDSDVPDVGIQRTTAMIDIFDQETIKPS